MIKVLVDRELLERIEQWVQEDCTALEELQAVLAQHAEAECDQIRDEVDALRKDVSGLVEALVEASQSLESIGKLAGRDPFLENMDDVRDYAHSRAGAARNALTAYHAAQKEGEI